MGRSQNGTESNAPATSLDKSAHPSVVGKLLANLLRTVGNVGGVRGDDLFLRKQEALAVSSDQD